MKRAFDWQRVLCGCTLAAMAGAAPAQEIHSTAQFRIPIRHADPWVVKALIEGLDVRTPEASTIPGFAGFLSRGVGAATSLLKDGFLVVNPTDNSLWYYPKH